jgi:hypothetical protein
VLGDEIELPVAVSEPEQKRSTLDYASPNREQVRPNSYNAWTLNILACICLVGEFFFTIESTDSIKTEFFPLLFFLAVLAAALASLLGLFGIRCARISGSVAARRFAVSILIGVGVGLGGMLAVIFVGGA